MVPVSAASKEVADGNSKQKFKNRRVRQPTAVQTLESL